MSTLRIVPLAFGFTIAIVSGALGQGVNYTANPSNPAADLAAGGLSLPGAGASATGAASTGNTGKDDPDDPTLQRLNGKDSLGQMARDEGQLTAKVRRREKVLHVESTKQLPTSGTDPKFQGSLLHSGVSSIENVGEKANTSANTNNSADANTNNSAEANTSNSADTDARNEDDPRFKTKRLIFTPLADENSKQEKAPRTKADSSPSPSPSPTASASPSSR